DGFLGGIHAAYRRAVVVFGISRTNALQKGNPLRLLPVEGPNHMAGVRSGGGENPLELQCREHIREAAITQVFLQSGIVDLVSGGQDDGAYVQLKLLLSLCVVDGVGLAGGLAEMAITADPASQTTLGLGHRFFHRVANVDLRKGSSRVAGSRAC